jgi:hypothetical protein
MHGCHTISYSSANIVLKRDSTSTAQEQRMVSKVRDRGIERVSRMHDGIFEMKSGSCQTRAATKHKGTTWRMNSCSMHGYVIADREFTSVRSPTSPRDPAPATSIGMQPCAPRRMPARPEHDVPQLPVEGTSCPVGKKGAWVTVRLCKAWNDRATECCVYINASRHHVASYLTHTLERYRFPGKHVEST